MFRKYSKHIFIGLAAFIALVILLGCPESRPYRHYDEGPSGTAYDDDYYGHRDRRDHVHRTKETRRTGKVYKTQKAKKKKKAARRPKAKKKMRLKKKR